MAQTANTLTKPRPIADWSRLTDGEFLCAYYDDLIRRRVSPDLMSDPVGAHVDMPTVTTSDPDSRYNLARKVVVLADTMCIQEDPGALRQELVLNSDSVCDNVLGDISYSTVIRSSDIRRLRRWLVDADGLIRSSRLIFVPQIEESCKGDDYERIMPLVSADERRMIFKVSEVCPAWIDQQKYLPLFRLELPYIENIDLPTFAKVMDDHPEELGAFRSYLTRALSALPALVGSEQSGEAMRKIQLELADGARATDLDYRRVRLVSGLRVGAAVTATWTFVLYAFFSDGSNLIKVLAPGGAMTLVARELADYIQARYEFKKSPFAFLAIAKRSAR